MLTSQENHYRHQQLEHRLKIFDIWQGQDVPDNTDWQPEHSVLVLGISRTEAIEVGQMFEQNAIVCGKYGEPAELVWIEQPNTPLAVLHIPHSSYSIPDNMRQDILLDDQQLAKEQLTTVDGYTDELFRIPATQATSQLALCWSSQYFLGSVLSANNWRASERFSRARRKGTSGNTPKRMLVRNAVYGFVYLKIHEREPFGRILRCRPSPSGRLYSFTLGFAFWICILVSGGIFLGIILRALFYYHLFDYRSVVHNVYHQMMDSKRHRCTEKYTKCLV